jgi:HD-like signal output (HDOD) protein
MTLTEQVNAVIAELSDDIKNSKLDLPSPPDILIKVRALSNNDNSNATDLANLVKFDPNIASRIIKIANSSLFGSRFHVNSVQSAVTRLGSSKVINLITGSVIAQNFINAQIKGLESYFNKVWQKSNKVSAICYVLAQQKSTIDPEQALLAGMVHNIGILPLILRLNKISAFRDEPKLLIHVANQVVPKLYPKAGNMILTNWNFSPSIAAVAVSHNKLNRESTGPIDLDDLILVSFELSRLADFTDSDNIPEKLVDSATFQKFWSNWTEAATALSELKEQIEQINSVFKS